MTIQEKYNLHYKELVKDVIPKEDLNDLIEYFINDSATNMGSDIEKSGIIRITEIVSNQFRFLPVHFIASGFKKGSLGHYGTGRLVPRTVYGWLNEIALEYTREQAHEKYNTPIGTKYNELTKYPLGKAIILKMGWLERGVIDSNDWDNIPLKEVAERIGQGLECVPELFGIESKNKI